jgi:hypothetical protein
VLSSRETNAVSEPLREPRDDDWRYVALLAMSFLAGVWFGVSNVLAPPLVLLAVNAAHERRTFGVSARPMLRVQWHLAAAVAGFFVAYQILTFLAAP